MVAAPAGTRALTNAKLLSGSSAIPVPNAINAKPSQIQLTSGLTVTWNAADWSPTSYVASVTYRSSEIERRIATSVVGSVSCLR